MIKRLMTYAVTCAMTYAFVGCGKEEPDEPSCRELLSACEFVGQRTSGDFIIYFTRIQDCSYDYGACIGYPGTDCEEVCNENTLLPSQCKYSCEYASSHWPAERDLED